MTNFINGMIGAVKDYWTWIKVCYVNPYFWCWMAILFIVGITPYCVLMIKNKIEERKEMRILR